MESTREHLYTQRLYPSVNNDDLLEFRMPPNSKGQLDLANVKLHFIASLHTPSDSAEILPENYFGAKQFSSLEVRINGEAVTRRSCSNEYFLSAYFQNYINYSLDYQSTALMPLGIFDMSQLKGAEIANFSAEKKAELKNSRAQVATAKEYEIIMPIDSTIFYSNDLLPSNTALDLSFERASASFSAIGLAAATKCSSNPLTLNDCYLLLPFKSDEEMFRMERNAIQRPLKVNFDDYVVRRFNVPKGTSSVMMSDVISGQLPEKVFWGLQTIYSYTGSYNISSTRFARNDLIKANVYIDGKSMDDYPITMSELHSCQPFVKFLSNTNQQLNNLMGKTISLLEYAYYNYILSASIPDQTGSMSFEFEFATELNHDLILIVLGVSEKTMRLDHNRNFSVT